MPTLQFDFSATATATQQPEPQQPPAEPAAPPRDTFEIPEANYADLAAKFDKTNKRAARLHLAPIVLTVLGRATVPVPDSDTLTRVMVTVKVTGAAPYIAGWHLAATLAHVEGLVIIRGVPGEAVPSQYRTAANDCDHCHTRRARNDTFILRHDSGRFAQIGRNCLQDFLPGTDPAALAAYAESIYYCLAAAEAAEDDDRPGPHAREEYHFNVEQFAALTAAVIRRDGWTSATTARDTGRASTVGAVLDEIFPRSAAWRAAVPEATPTEADRAEASAATNWARDLPETDNDYLYNLATVARLGHVTRRHLGLVASLIPAYRRSQETEHAAREARAVSHFVGQVGQRQEFTATVKQIRYIDGQYGTTTLYMLTDAAGNRLKWFASASRNGAPLEKDHTYTLKATVKAHELYNAIEETQLTRATVLSEAPPAELPMV